MSIIFIISKKKGVLEYFTKTILKSYKINYFFFSKSVVLSD